MAKQQRWFAGKPDYENWGLALASETEAYAGHLGKARELTKRAVGSAIRADSKENGAIWQAIAAQREAAYARLLRPELSNCVRPAKFSRTLRSPSSINFRKHR
jgi:hypothetical protein